MTLMIGEVLINLPQQRVFDLYTDARIACFNATVPTTVEHTNHVSDGPGAQITWRFIYTEFKMEMIETILEQDRPNRIASHMQINRILPLAPHETTPGVMPALAYDMREDYSPIFGKLPVEGAAEAVFYQQDGGTLLSVKSNMNVSGWARVSGWFLKFKKRSPLQAELEQFRDWMEANPVAGQ